MRTKALAVGISNIYTACLQVVLGAGTLVFPLCISSFPVYFYVSLHIPCSKQDIAKRDNAISEWQEQWQSMVLTLLMSPDNESARTCAVCWMRPTAKALPSLLAPLIDAIEAESVGGDEHGAMQAMLLLLSAACKQAVLSLDVILEDPRLRHVIVQSMHAADEDLQKEAISIILVSQVHRPLISLRVTLTADFAFCRQTQSRHSLSLTRAVTSSRPTLQAPALLFVR